MNAVFFLIKNNHFYNVTEQVFGAFKEPLFQSFQGHPNNLRFQAPTRPSNLKPTRSASVFVSCLSFVLLLLLLLVVVVVVVVVYYIVYYTIVYYVII